jgi:hypothetical protein
MRTDLKYAIDDARLRYRRILIPLLAYTLAQGRPERIDPAYELVFLLSIGLGVFWSCRFVRERKLTPAWGLLFVLMPAIPISMDRLVVDAGLAALTAGFLLYSPDPSWKLFVLLAAAPLTRETGFLLVLGYAISLACQRAFQTAGVYLLAAVPALVWYGYVGARTEGKSYGMLLTSLSALLETILNRSTYPTGTPFVRAIELADEFALCGVFLAFGLAVYYYLQSRCDSVRVGGALFALMGVILLLVRPPGDEGTAQLFRNVYHFGRVFTPLLACLAGVGAQRRSLLPLAPAAMMLPRVAIQLTPQVLGVIRWIT